MNERREPPTNREAAPTEKASDADFVVNQFGETILYAPPSECSAQTASPAVQLPGTIGRYEVRALLGRGGFGVVFRGYDSQLDRQVAIKVPALKPTEDLEELFVHEARQLAQLKHPSIVTVHDVGVHEGIYFIVSEYLEGQNLNYWLQDRTIGWQQAAGIAATLADALAAAHAHSIVHRDVKPANIIRTDLGEGPVPVLVDFGLSLGERTAVTSLSQRGWFTGTPN